MKKNHSKLERFPLGTIQPKGFLRDQTLRLKDGIGGHLPELEPDMIQNPYTNKTYVAKWGNGDQSGWGAEISGNYWAGLIQLAYTLKDDDLIRMAENWVNAMLKKQKSNGYLGTYYEEDAKIYEDYNAWGTACGMRGLIAFYEATGREDVLNAVYRCMLWFRDTWTGDHKTSYAGPYIIEPMIFCWYHTGDDSLVDFCVEYEEYLVRHDIFRKSYKAMQKPFRYFSDHTAGVANTLRLPALIYSANGNEEYLHATEEMLEKVRLHSNHLTGSPVSVTEYLGPVGSTTETEYCSYAYYNQLYTYLSYITGNSKYGDYMEELFYNGAQGARKKDEKAIAYLSAPNQIFATDVSSNWSGVNDMQVYAPCYPVACCPVNAVSVVPEFIRGMILHNGDDLYFTAYGPCEMNWKGISVSVDTLYPFRNEVRIHLSAQKEFGLFLKIPCWAEGYTVTVNGQETACPLPVNGYIELRKLWSGKDTVEIRFKASVRIDQVNDDDCAGKHPLAIRYGALVYSFPIPEKWNIIAGNPMTPLPEGWHWYSVWPDYQEADVPDPHDMIGLRRYQYSWNIALDENLKPEDITVEERPVSGYVWSEPPVRLHLKGWKAPFLNPTYAIHSFEPFIEKQPVTEETELTLVPYGATNLRITYFPKADIKDRE